MRLIGRTAVAVAASEVASQKVEASEGLGRQVEGLFEV